ncbi:MAG: selenocysteine-specific translation elongation factor [Terracidiphilus sp.]|jgi:selenocysteine-specific elongation factor
MTNLSKSVVIGTAGHIDHGKTTLVRALTGIDTDRLPEEKRRGITIDLGFASFETQAPDGSPLRISFVDVPGHSLFVRNMLAGAGCVPAVMLVVAANEGIMPQTVEHLAICELLGISQGMTVITKADAVSDSQLLDVTQSIERFLQGTFLGKDHAPVLPMSATTGEGTDAVRAELAKLAVRIHRGSSDALLRMPLDRSFVMKGFGTVVTGTLMSGTMHIGQTLHLEPGGRTVRVRGLQSHGLPQQSVEPGSRVAANLSGIDANEIHRGQTLVSPKTLSPVDTIDAEVHLLQGAPALKHRANIHFHAFTSETMASIFLYGYEAVQPGTVRLMRIKLAEPIVLVPGDRFVLRQPSPAGTIGGGRVLDTHPEARQRKAATVAWLDQLTTACPAQQISLRVARRKTMGIALDALSAETGLTVDAIRGYAGPALQCGELLAVSENLLLSRENFLTAASAIMTFLGAGIAVKSSVLRSRTALGPEVFDYVLSSQVREKKFRLCGEMVSVHSVDDEFLSADTERLAAVASALREAGLAAPSVMELARKLNLDEAEMRRLVTLLQRDKTIVRMGDDNLFIHSEALNQLSARITLLRGKLMDVAGFKQLTGLSRKYAIPLLEYLDRQRITRNQGDQRLIL